MNNLIHIHTVPDKYTADLVKGFLESNEIKCLIEPSNIGPSGGYAGAPAVAPGPWKIYVFKEKELEARKLIEDKELLRIKEQGPYSAKVNRVPLIFKVISLIVLAIILFWVINICRLFIQNRF